MKKIVGLVLTMTFGLHVVSHAATLPEQEMVTVLKQAELFVELQRKAGFSDEQILNDVLAQVEESKAALEPVMKLKTTQENQERMLYFAAGVVSTLVVGGVVWGIIHLINKEEDAKKKDEKKDDSKKDENKDDEKGEPVSEEEVSSDPEEEDEDSELEEEPEINPNNQGSRSFGGHNLLDSDDDSHSEQSTSDEEEENDIPNPSTPNNNLSSSSSSKVAPDAPEQSRTRSLSGDQLNQIPFSLNTENPAGNATDRAPLGPVRRVQFEPLPTPSSSSSSNTAPQSPEREVIGSGSDSEQPPLGHVRFEVTVGDKTVTHEQTFNTPADVEEFVIDPSNITQTIRGTAPSIPAKKVLLKLPEQSGRTPRTTKQAAERAKLEENRMKERAKTLAEEAVRVKKGADMTKAFNEEMPGDDVFESGSSSDSSSEDTLLSPASESTSPSSSDGFVHSDSELNHSGSHELVHDEGYESPTF
ncbi:hypothetical protein K2X40_04610 [Candidatus Babeliales bacterium]|nr:hypothetical protein [Candidatus Babeliales bacterium]